MTSEVSTVPIYHKQTENDERPKEPLFYWLTASGLFRCRNAKAFRSDVICLPPGYEPVSKWSKSTTNTKQNLSAFPPHLAPHSVGCVLTYPPITADVLGEMVGFFMAAYNRYKSEAFVHILWNFAEKRYELSTPTQRVPECGLHVDYDPWRSEPGKLLVGDAHSHGDCAAFSSMTDEDDDAVRDGLHIIVGRLTGNPVQWHLDFCVDGQRFDLTNDAKFLIDNYTGPTDSPSEWLDRITVTASKHSRFWGSGGYDWYSPTRRYSYHDYRDTHYDNQHYNEPRPKISFGKKQKKNKQHILIRLSVPSEQFGKEGIQFECSGCDLLLIAASELHTRRISCPRCGCKFDLIADPSATKVTCRT